MYLLMVGYTCCAYVFEMPLCLQHACVAVLYRIVRVNMWTTTRQIIRRNMQFRSLTCGAAFMNKKCMQWTEFTFLYRGGVTELAGSVKQIGYWLGFLGTVFHIYIMGKHTDSLLSNNVVWH